MSKETSTDLASVDISTAEDGKTLFAALSQAIPREQVLGAVRRLANDADIKVAARHDWAVATLAAHCFHRNRKAFGASS